MEIVQTYTKVYYFPNSKLQIKLTHNSLQKFYVNSVGGVGRAFIDLTKYLSG